MKALKFLLLPVMVLFWSLPACELDPVDPDGDDPRDKFLGEWKVNESCRRGNYTSVIKPDPGNSAQVLIENFGNPGPGYDDAVGLVSTNYIYVSSQIIGEGWTVSGKGTYQAGGTISWDYTLVIGPSQLDCSATYSY
jgi:hypothetical protein